MQTSTSNRLSIPVDLFRGAIVLYAGIIIVFVGNYEAHKPAVLIFIGLAVAASVLPGWESLPHTLRRLLNRLRGVEGDSFLPSGKMSPAVALYRNFKTLRGNDRELFPFEFEPADLWVAHLASRLESKFRCQSETIRRLQAENDQYRRNTSDYARLKTDLTFAQNKFIEAGREINRLRELNTNREQASETLEWERTALMEQIRRLEEQVETTGRERDRLGRIVTTIKDLSRLDPFLERWQANIPPHNDEPSLPASLAYLVHYSLFHLSIGLAEGRTDLQDAMLLNLLGILEKTGSFDEKSTRDCRKEIGRAFGDPDMARLGERFRESSIKGTHTGSYERLLRALKNFHAVEISPMYTYDQKERKICVAN